jgi:hypothetical protein
LICPSLSLVPWVPFHLLRAFVRVPHDKHGCAVPSTHPLIYPSIHQPISCHCRTRSPPSPPRRYFSPACRPGACRRREGRRAPETDQRAARPNPLRHPKRYKPTPLQHRIPLLRRAPLMLRQSSALPVLAHGSPRTSCFEGAENAGLGFGVEAQQHRIGCAHLPPRSYPVQRIRGIITISKVIAIRALPVAVVLRLVATVHNSGALRHPRKSPRALCAKVSSPPVGGPAERKAALLAPAPYV